MVVADGDLSDGEWGVAVGGGGKESSADDPRSRTAQRKVTPDETDTCSAGPASKRLIWEDNR